MPLQIKTYINLPKNQWQLQFMTLIVNHLWILYLSQWLNQLHNQWYNRLYNQLYSLLYNQLFNLWYKLHHK